MDAVYALASAPPFEDTLEAGDELVVSYFSESLEDLGLTEGRVTPASGEVCYSRSPPPALAAFRLQGSRLEALNEDPLASRKFAYERPCPCRDLEISLLELPAHTQRIAGISRLGPGLALITLQLTDSSSILMVYDDASGDLVETATTAPVLSMCSHTGSPAYLAFSSRRFMLYEHPGGLRSGPDLPPGSYAEALACSAAGQPEEVFAIDTGGRAHRFDGITWNTVYDPGPERPRNPTNLGTITWVAPGRVVFVSSDSASIVYLRGERAQVVSWGPEQTLSPTRGGVRQLLHTEQPGLLMLTRAQVVLVDRESNGQWEELVLPTEGSNQVASFQYMAAMPGGVLAAAEDSGIWEYNLTLARYCEPVSAGRDLLLRRMERIEDSLFLAGGEKRGASSPNQLAIVRVR